MSSALKAITRSGAVGLAAFLFGAALMVGATPGTEGTAATNLPSGQVQTAGLEYTEVGYSPLSQSLRVVTQSTPFTKEPEFAGSKVFRGALQPGGGASNSIAFVWNRAAGKLYLDLNRNLDLTDDPAGVFTARKEGTVYSQTFTNVHLFLNTASGKCQVLADLNFYDYVPRPGCELAVHSLWQGQITLQGRDWQAGVIPDLSSDVHSFEKSFEKGWLLLRPRDKRDRAFSTADGSLDAFPFTRKLFVGDHAYQVNCAIATQNGEIKPALEFVEQSVTLGELKITGQYIQRLALSGEPYLVILDQPAALVKVPIGNYSQPDVRLEQGGAKASCAAHSWPSGQRVTVNDKMPTVLNVGGPLTNSVTATRRGRNLQLDYRLLGAGGATYQLENQDRSRPPEFVIYKGDKKVTSGKFAFG